MVTLQSHSMFFCSFVLKMQSEEGKMVSMVSTSTPSLLLLSLKRERSDVIPLLHILWQSGKKRKKLIGMMANLKDPIKCDFRTPLGIQWRRTGCGANFRGKKGTWKGKHFTQHDTTAKRLADKPTALTEGEWKDLVTFWETDATHQKYSEQNVKSRSCQQVKHTMGRKNHARCKSEMVQMREQSGLDENGFDEDGNQHPISDEVYGNVLPITRQKRVRAERYPTCSSYERNEDFERRMKERDEDFDRRIRERDAEWEARLKACDEEDKMRENKMLEYVRLCYRPGHVLSPGQFSGPSDYHFRPAQPLFAPWEQPYRPLDQHNGSEEQPYRHVERLVRPANQPYKHEEQLVRPAEQSNRIEEQLYRSQNDCKYQFP
ncbi:hypothetical protein C5167_025305 [Papaver somniferum]|uniref:Uncharacterized protein n=1 Tax=Papaver somniferum TaxID=3469 RepID=A0A4Y7JV28_PAPSO|nr:hypothetical protein C5167_025305 [Papaver somniferum]